MVARLPLSTLVYYSLPSAALGFTFMLTGVYLLKYSADVLLIAPWLMGVIYGASRFWDAVSDPIAGYLSDRTQSRLGRRRSWILASALPMGLGFWMMWSPPLAVAGTGLVVWMAAGVFVYFTAITVFTVPHEALGAELSTDTHDRTRVFGVKAAAGMLGSLAGLGGMALLEAADDPRRVALAVSLFGVVALAGLTLLAVVKIRERPEYQGRGSTDIRAAFRDVAANPYAALLLLVLFVETFGTATLALLVPFVMEYVLGMKSLTTVFIAIYFIPGLLFIPVWVRMARVVGKKRLWLIAMVVMTLAFGGLFFVGPGDIWLVSTLGLVAGVGGGCGQVVGPSLQADVIDFDEYRTGERKEGAYFAVWNFVRKTAYAAAAMLTGGMLTLVGFEPNVAQSESTQVGLRLLFSVVPGVCYLAGTLAFVRFRLDAAEHAGIRRSLDERASAESARDPVRGG